MVGVFDDGAGTGAIREEHEDVSDVDGKGQTGLRKEKPWEEKRETKDVSVRGGLKMRQ